MSRRKRHLGKRQSKKLVTAIISLVIAIGAGAFGVEEFALKNTTPEVEETSSIETNEKSQNEELQSKNLQSEKAEEEAEIKTQTAREINISLADIPAFTDNPYVVIHNNVPYFEDAELTTTSFETYAELDNLGRCGVASASIGTDIMPTEERGGIGMVKPSGWHTIKYDCVDGKYLFNRCHLIGYQLAGENANVQNLITGTRYLNTVGMLPFENMVADYVKETNYHVQYRVTPIFAGNNLVASGVLMEAKSVEDNGDGLEFNVYCYNNQPGVTIDYATGESCQNE